MSSNFRGKNNVQNDNKNDDKKYAHSYKIDAEIKKLMNIITHISQASHND